MPQVKEWGGGGEKRKETSLPLPLFHFLALVSFLPRPKPTIPFLGLSGFASKPNENACYAG